MPYHIAKSSSCPASKPYAVIKNADGKVMGCHASEKDAQKQMSALYAVGRYWHVVLIELGLYPQEDNDT